MEEFKSMEQFMKTVPTKKLEQLEVGPKLLNTIDPNSDSSEDETYWFRDTLIKNGFYILRVFAVYRLNRLDSNFEADVEKNGKTFRAKIGVTGEMIYQ